MILELPTKDLNKGAGFLVDRLKLSHHATKSLFARIIPSTCGELRDSSYRHRILAEGGARKKLKEKYESLSAANPYRNFILKERK